MYTLMLKGTFDAAHKLPGVEICENLHGHTWHYKIEVKSVYLNDKSMVIDFREIKNYIKENYDHKFLNEKIGMPTAENIAARIYTDLQDIFFKQLTNPSMKPVVNSVEIWESENSGVIYND